VLSLIVIALARAPPLGAPATTRARRRHEIVLDVGGHTAYGSKANVKLGIAMREVRQGGQKPEGRESSVIVARRDRVVSPQSLRRRRRRRRFRAIVPLPCRVADCPRTAFLVLRTPGVQWRRRLPTARSRF
jgi:hypothetical protein